MNTPELSAGRGGGLSQGLPANGPYISLFRAGPRSESRVNASSHTLAVAPALSVLAEAAQSPGVLSLVSPATAPPKAAFTLTPAPAPTSG